MVVFMIMIVIMLMFMLGVVRLNFLNRGGHLHRMVTISIQKYIEVVWDASIIFGVVCTSMNLGCVSCEGT